MADQAKSVMQELAHSRHIITHNDAATKATLKSRSVTPENDAATAIFKNTVLAGAFIRGLGFWDSESLTLHSNY